MSDFFRDIVKQLNDDNTNIATDGANSSEYSGCIDSGSHILNAALTGSLYGGVPNNKITAFAGESATGKTFFVLGIVQHFLNSNPDAGVFYFDTEAAVTRGMMEDRGIDTGRVPGMVESSRRSRRSRRSTVGKIQIPVFARGR